MTEEGRATMLEAAARGRRSSLPAALGRRKPVWAGQLLVVAVAVGLWYLATAVGLISTQLLPTPSSIVSAFVRIVTEGQVQQGLGRTVREFLVAFVAGTLLGGVAGTALGLSKVLEEAYAGPLVFLTSTPKVIFLPVFMLVLGIGTTAIEAFGAFEAFFYVAVAVMGAVGMVDRRHLRTAHAYGAGPAARLLSVVLPAAAPGLASAVWFGIKQALLGVLIGELYASTGGVGTLITTYTQTLNTDSAFAVVLMISAIAVVLGVLFRSLEKRMNPRNRRRGSSGRPSAPAEPPASSEPSALIDSVRAS